MLKQVTQFKSVINEIETIFHFEANCPVNIAKEALLECLKWLGQVEDRAKAQAEAEAKKAEEENQQQTEQEPQVVDEQPAL